MTDHWNELNLRMERAFQEQKRASESRALRDHFAAAALTGLLYPEVDDEFAMPYIVGRAYLWADAMLRERSRAGQNSSEGTGSAAECTERDIANHDAAPAARASGESVVPQPTPRGDSDRTDNAAPRPSGGTGDTPATHATRGEGSEQRECTEPVAWGVVYPNGMFGVLAFYRRDAEGRATASDRIVPLYRHPPCQDFSQKNLTLTDCERGAIERAVDSIAATMPYESQQGLADWKTLRGLLRRMGGAK